MDTARPGPRLHVSAVTAIAATTGTSVGLLTWWTSGALADGVVVAVFTALCAVLAAMMVGGAN